MKGLDNSLYLSLFIISNIVAVIMLFTAFKTPRISRVLFLLLFAWASYKNFTTAIYTPTAYLDYTDLTFSETYKQFIQGWFSHNITIAVCFVAACQAFIAASMLVKGFIFKAGAVSAIIFLIAIAPLGVGAAFPCTLIMAAALFVLLKKAPKNYLWYSDKKSVSQQSEINIFI